MRTVATNIYNEEFLLPHWLKHHVNIFDEGIVLDYNSTDSSLDIVRELAPHWKIVTAQQHDRFDATINNIEMLMIEKSIPSGWKTSLNVTEFVFGNFDLPELMAFHSLDTIVVG